MCTKLLTKTCKYLLITDSVPPCGLDSVCWFSVGTEICCSAANRAIFFASSTSWVTNHLHYFLPASHAEPLDVVITVSHSFTTWFERSSGLYTSNFSKIYSQTYVNVFPLCSNIDEWTSYRIEILNILSKQWSRKMLIRMNKCVLYNKQMLIEEQMHVELEQYTMHNSWKNKNPFLLWTMNYICRATWTWDWKLTDDCRGS